MSRKVKSELTFILKISLLFLILFANKLNKSPDILTAAKDAISPKESISVITASIRD
ncbi:MAG: hypothetical protein ABJF11_17250 [Reichenbachiella sp.]|uniref:hypothetical protein n=1 Tax=Reichenbachiella sp. TaxID=2184521 RepID=UPI003267A27C